MANVPSASQINNTHLGLQQQAVDYGEKVVATKSAAQEKLDAAYSAAGDKVSAARTAYFNAQENPNVSPAKLAQLKESYQVAKDERATIGEQAESNQASLEKAQGGLDANKVNLANAQNTAGSTGTSVTSSTPVFNDAVADKAENIGSNNTVPVGETVNAADPVAPNATLQPSEENPFPEDQAQVSEPTPEPPQEEGFTPLQEPPGTQDEFSGIDEQVANNENALQEPPDVNPDEDPMQAALDANRTEDTPGPTEQEVIDVTDDPQLTKEDQAKLEEEQAANRAALAQEESAAGFEVKSVNAVRAKAVESVQRNARQQEDWRVRLQLAQGATYLYNDPSCKQGDLLFPLKATGGVIFPYTPAISSSYRANYDPSDIVHTNYKQYFYKNSSVDELSIQADFTAQDTTEALYMLAVIHFFKSVTKMFYGKDANPRAGTPPPLCYLSGYGQYQYSDHPLLVTSFAYNLPNDVDYIRAGSTTQWAGQNVGSYGSAPAATSKGFSLSSLFRLGSSKLNKGGISSEPTFSQLSNSQATYVPTKLSIQLGLVPVVTRYDIANNFSVTEYAKGKLIKGGIW